MNASLNAMYMHIHTLIGVDMLKNEPLSKSGCPSKSFRGRVKSWQGEEHT